jgi:zinc transporter 1/2/3
MVCFFIWLGQSLLNVTTDVHGHGVGSHAAHGPENVSSHPTPSDDNSAYEKHGSDIEASHQHADSDGSGMAQIIGVFILEFGVLLHR